MRRSVSLVVLAAASALLLTACAGGGGAKAKSTPKPTSSAAASIDLGCSIKEGDATKAVQVTGDAGTAPTVNVPKGTTAKAEQRAVVTEGTGEKPKAGTTVIIGFAAYDATSGNAISAPYGYGDQKGLLQIQLGDASKVPGLTHAFGCEPVGTRTVYAAPASVAFGNADNVKNNFSDGSVKATDTVVFVGDILGQLAEKADGADQTPQAGFPTVKLAKDGTPSISYDKKSTPPTTTQIEVLKKGTGATVTAGDTVTVQYQGTEWKSGKIFDESWGDAHGGTYPSTPASFATTDVVKGFGDALVGQTVGSQVEVVIPPADGYGDNPPQNQTTITKTSTLVFVIDILYTAATPAQQ
ncbi:FKBP-type peptidyl-prolyl cis-trans isomerase [Gryllotalpicola protaetiae]|uniref:FKBP-type peptidyl-prolyl cis-trans isomerase n=1 Tax=Gryllotalpicola protaetiae TaxID=2419771 RepID=UPI001FE4BC40|nr:FKBP-type peptidyl-prolyl cis-trans isomerase [Gryllotalpicola protaetiae]